MPVQLAARLRRSHFLFLGYAIVDWSLRVFLQRVWGGDRLAYRSWAVAAGRRARRAASSGVSAASRSTTSRSRMYAGRARAAHSRLAGVAHDDAACRHPYKGSPYFGDSEHDCALFFGRERETEVVAANLMASRLTVLYGPSGVGKSSLLRAGVARRLRALVPAAGGDDQGAEVVIVDSWRDDPILAVAVAAGAPTDIPLADALAERCDP